PQGRACRVIDRLFQLRARGTDLRTEVVGGASTFAALSYIVFVQPAVLATTGMEPGAVLAATCLASAFATALMGLWANYPMAAAGRGWCPRRPAGSSGWVIGTIRRC